jgi:uncharacterized damage-inducible protein DinB
MSASIAESIHAYETAPLRIRAVIEGLHEEQFHYIPAKGEWSIHEIIIHLADSEVVGFRRIHQTLAEPGTTIQLFDENAWAKQLLYHQQDYTLAMNLFTALRNSTAALLRSLPEEAWERTGIHPEHGEVNVYQLLNTYLGHSDVHIQQIERIKQTFPSTL